MWQSNPYVQIFYYFLEYGNLPDDNQLNYGLLSELPCTLQIHTNITSK